MTPTQKPTTAEEMQDAKEALRESTAAIKESAAATESPFEWEVSHDHDLLHDRPLARIRWRRTDKPRARWESFVVVMDDETNYETVEANAGQLVALYAARSS